MTATNIEITVDFDGIVQNMKPVDGVYSGCDSYVTYSGKPVNGTTITLTKDKDYTFTLAALNGNKCVATEIKSFASQDGHLNFVTDNNDLQLDCSAKSLDKSGVNVTLTVTFNNQKGIGYTAMWDPKIKVGGGTIPPL